MHRTKNPLPAPIATRIHTHGNRLQRQHARGMAETKSVEEFVNPPAGVVDEGCEHEAGEFVGPRHAGVGEAVESCPIVLEEGGAGLGLR